MWNDFYSVTLQDQRICFRLSRKNLWTEPTYPYYAITVFVTPTNKNIFWQKIRLTSLSMMVIKRNFCLGTPPTERLERDVLSGNVRPRPGAFGSSGLKRWRPVRTEIEKTRPGYRFGVVLGIPKSWPAWCEMFKSMDCNTKYWVKTWQKSREM